ncbi:helix-turn-helix domain-containing protein [Leptospira meyeri]|uniref:helix-turn-helix domain-containing protein n=1 Tax=Leptospira meyeri TaxID=29508 RepID=UPI00108429A1|nr:helix-turn-helix transcriptional regulator [Leptospira meyeri]TGL13505.1 helix-turn-helix domain-containing protein [Leptospira meyeri]
MKEIDDRKETQEPGAFALKIAKLREKIGVSQTELAERANMSPAALSRILSGERVLKPEHARELAKALQVTTLELLQETEFMEVWHGWVEISDLFALQRRLETRENDLHSLRIQHEGLRAENVSLKDQLLQMINRLDQSEKENALLKGQLQNSLVTQEEIGVLRNQVATLLGERNNQISQTQTLQSQHITLKNQYQNLQSVAQQLHMRLTQVSRELQESKSSNATSALLSAIAGFGLAKVLEEN